MCDALLVSCLIPPGVMVMTVALAIAAFPSATTAAVSLAISVSSPLLFAAPLQRGQPLSQHGRRRHELPGFGFSSCVVA